jgi:hypothetical protein
MRERWRIASRVAAKLGLDEAQVKDAFNQAVREMEDEALQQKLDRMVERGRVSQEQADEYRQWYLSRPDGPIPDFPFRRFGRGRFWDRHGRHGEGFHKEGVSPAPPPESSES